MKLTTWDDHPHKVDQKVIEPEVKCFRSAVDDIVVIHVKRVGHVVQYQTVNLASRYERLDRVSVYGVDDDEIGFQK